MILRNGKIILFFTLFICFMWVENCEAKERTIPASVQIVRNENQMIQAIVKGMKQHKEYFEFYYDGIEKEFRTYRKKDANYMAFWEKIAKKDGYHTGILSGNCIYLTGEKKYVVIQVQYITSKKQEKFIDKKVKQIVRKIGRGTTKTKVRKAHDYLLWNVQYCDGYGNPYYIFAKGKGMCMSYSLAFQRIMQEMNIPCRYVRGKNHAWNQVRIKGIWYNVDVTWDDCSYDSYLYFLKRDAEFLGHDNLKR